MLCKQQIGKWVRHRGPQIGFAVVVLLVNATLASGATKYWSGGTGDWSSGSNWGSPPATPGSGDTVYIGNGGTAQVTTADSCAALYVGSSQLTRPGNGIVNVKSSGGNLTVGGAISVGVGSGSYWGKITQEAGSVSAASETIGTSSASSSITQTGGTNNITGALQILAGSYNLNGGTLHTGTTQVATGATYQVIVSASTSLSLYSQLNSSDSNALHLLGSVLAEDATISGSTVTMQWRVRTPSEIGTLFLASDVLTLGGISGGPTQAYVLGMNYDPTTAPTGATVGWYNGSTWDPNAVDGNSGNNATGGQLGYIGSFTAFEGVYGSTLDSYIGAYGYDPTAHQAWAVLDHASSFAAAQVVPEPATLLLLATGLLGMIAYGWRKRK